MNSRIQQLFERYEAGTATGQERKLVEAWYERTGENKASEFNDLDFTELDNRIKAVLSEPAIRGLKKYLWLKVAAAVLIAGSAGVLTAHFIASPTTAKVTYTLIKSLNGQKKQVILADGTIVNLNSGSTLSIASNYNQKNREITLVGEAFFDVRHDASKPFIIHSGKLQTTDVGTSFDIKAYPEDEHINVAVTTGKVKVEQTGEDGKLKLCARELIHNNLLTYNKTSKSETIQVLNTDGIIAWRFNHLIFDNASYTEIAAVLERWYNVQVILHGDYTKSRRYTLSFYNEPVTNVLNVLSRLTGMTYQITGKTIIINTKKM